MRQLRWRFAAALALLCSAAPVHPATEGDVDTAKRLALVLVSKGQPNAALFLLAPLAERFPDDPEVLIARSRAHRALGAHDTAIQLARHAFAQAENQSHKHLAARVLAEALASNGQHTRAQIWLRRAGQTAPTEAARTSVQRDYAYVRSRNPWAFSFRGAITPTDNANDAPTSDESIIGGLVFRDPSAQPIAGIEYHFGGTATYRFAATETTQTELRFSYDGRRTDLEDSATDIDPSIRNSDFSSDRITIEWAGRFRRPDQPGVYDAALATFFDWNGGDRSQDGLRAIGGYTFPVGERSQLRVGLEVEDLDRRDREVRSSTTKRATLDWSHRTEGANLIRLHFSYADTSSDSAAVAHESVRFRANYYFAKPVMNAQIGLGLDLRASMFDRPLYGPDPREDDALGLSATATFSELDVYGFAPVLELRRDRVFSNVSGFDTETVQLSVSFRSTY